MKYMFLICSLFLLLDGVSMSVSWFLFIEPLSCWPWYYSLARSPLLLSRSVDILWVMVLRSQVVVAVCWNWPQAQRSHVWFMGKCNDMHNKESLQKNDNIAKSTVKHGFWPVAKWNLFHSVTVVVVSAVLASCDDSACRCFGRICPHRYRPFATWCDLPAHGAGKTINKLTLGIGRLRETCFSRVFSNFDHLDGVKPYKALTWP